jgi:integrase/recombinase XerD
MKVTLRSKALKSGKQSLYLDYYSAGGGREYEFLQLYLFKRPKDELERQHNKEIKGIADRIRASREVQLNEEEQGLRSTQKRKINFIEYFENYLAAYPNKDRRIVKYCLQYFKEFTGNKKKVLPAEITEQVCINFRAHLDQNLNGETPHNYFAKFKKLLRQATREGVFLRNPAEDVQNPRPEGIKKDVLTLDEIKALANAYCGNSEVKRAFLFACFTGLRWVDVEALTWTNIHKTEDGLQLKVKQAKTEIDVMVNLNATARKVLGELGKRTDKVFTLPSHTGMLKSLRLWGEKAGINKKITFHVARHSFATNLLLKETDLKTVSTLLGHTTLEHTTKYVRVVNQLKEQAVNKLEIEI